MYYRQQSRDILVPLLFGLGLWNMSVPGYGQLRGISATWWNPVTRRWENATQYDSSGWLGFDLPATPSWWRGFAEPRTPAPPGRTWWQVNEADHERRQRTQTLLHHGSRTAWWTGPSGGTPTTRQITKFGWSTGCPGTQDAPARQPSSGSSSNMK
jgi:hypothetical protein